MENNTKTESPVNEPVLVTDIDLINETVKRMEINADNAEKEALKIRKNIESLKALRSCIGNTTPLSNEARHALKGLMRNLLT